MVAKVEAIYITASAGQMMTPVSMVEAIAGEGLQGDRYYSKQGYYSNRPLPGGGRQLTLIEREALQSLAEETGIHLSEEECRRNLVTSGVRLNALVEKRFFIGRVLCEGVRLCEPCVYLEELTGKPVLKPLLNRGGLRANILFGGSIALGDWLREGEPVFDEFGNSTPSG